MNSVKILAFAMVVLEMLLAQQGLQGSAIAAVGSGEKIEPESKKSGEDPRELGKGPCDHSAQPNPSGGMEHAGALGPGMMGMNGYGMLPYAMGMNGNMNPYSMGTFYPQMLGMGMMGYGMNSLSNPMGYMGATGGSLLNHMSAMNPFLLGPLGLGSPTMMGGFAPLGGSQIPPGGMPPITGTFGSLYNGFPAANGYSNASGVGFSPMSNGFFPQPGMFPRPNFGFGMGYPGMMTFNGQRPSNSAPRSSGPQNNPYNNGGYFQERRLAKSAAQKSASVLREFQTALRLFEKRLKALQDARQADPKAPSEKESENKI